MEKEKEFPLSIMIEQNKQMSSLESQVEQLLKEIQQAKDIVSSSSQVSSVEKDVLEDLTKEFSYLTLKNQEIDELKQDLEKAQQEKLKSGNSLVVELQQNSRLHKQIEWHLSQANNVQCLIEAKEIIWMEIISSIFDVWRLIEIMVEQEEQLERAKMITFLQKFTGKNCVERRISKIT